MIVMLAAVQDQRLLSSTPINFILLAILAVSYAIAHSNERAPAEASLRIELTFLIPELVLGSFLLACSSKSSSLSSRRQSEMADNLAASESIYQVLIESLPESAVVAVHSPKSI